MRISGEHIHDISRKLAEEVRQKRVEDAKPSDAQKAGAARTDEVILSQQAREVRVGLQSVGNVPDARGQQVEELTRKVREGTYRVDSQTIADAMLREISARESA